MENYYKTLDQPLEPDELRKLKRGFIMIPIMMIFFSVFFYIALSWSAEFGDGFVWAIEGFAALFGIVILSIIRGYVLDLRDQTKEVFQGLITRKTSRRSSKGNNSYFLYFGHKRMKVELNLYGKFQEGDLIEIHRSKRLYNLIYDSRLIRRGVMLEEVSELRRKQKHKERKLGVYLFASMLFIVIALRVAFKLGYL